MLLSIAVPSYNAQETLGRCLSSFADGRFLDRLEVLIIDDGSQDDTAAVAQRFVQAHPGIFRLISQPNAGHGGAVNTGIAAAGGKYFRIVDADDWMDSDALAKLLSAMESLSPDMFLDERTENWETSGREVPICLPKSAPFGRIADFSSITGSEFFPCISMHTVTPRTELLRTAGVRLMEHAFYVDMQYVIGIACFARTVTAMQLSVYHYALGIRGQSVNPVNYVRNYAQHDRVLKACARYCAENANQMPPGREEYVRTLLTLLAHTQYNIALIYNPDRQEGARQARELTAFLSNEFPWLARATRKRRYTAHLLHDLGVDYHWLQRLKSVVGRA